MQSSSFRRTKYDPLAKLFAQAKIMVYGVYQTIENHWSYEVINSIRG
ncbi:hypothetical protein Pmgp_03746 [Pelotomaculum propionicicum]|uniref:Uncharacterized protein n=1 Tax=Pelotomaculum propionicicum TaxID=258475 RepID=A0A4Y7RCC9_9FIRM|nr:hypothetical protein Pmgp_03746 [Pelotomaculum propionicicum]